MSMATPFLRVLSRLSVGRKLMLIYLLDLSAVIFVSSILINEKFIAIDFARKEIAGNAYIAEMRGGLVAAALMSGQAPAIDPGLAERPAQLAAAEAAHGAGMGSAEASTALAVAYSRLAQAVPEERQAALTALLMRGRELITRVGNQSNLILDPDLDSYYTMSLIVLRYPELLEVIDGIGVKLAAQVQAGTAAADARTQYLILEGKLDASRQAIDSDHGEAIGAGSAALKTQLQPAQRQLQAALEAFRSSARALIEQGATPQALQAAQTAQGDVVRALHGAWDAAGSAMTGLLEVRVTGLYQRMWLHLGTALALLLAILGIVYVVARQIAPPLSLSLIHIYRIDLDVVGGKFNRHGLRQLHHSAFGGAVRGCPGCSKDRVHAGQVDDLAALANNHGPRGNLREQERGGEMRCERCIPRFQGFVQNATTRQDDSCVVDQDVYRTQFQFNPGHGWRQRIAGRDVELECDGTGAACLQLSQNGTVLLFVPCKDRDRCARARQADGDRSADAPVSASDYRDLPGEIEERCDCVHVRLRFRRALD